MPPSTEVDGQRPSRGGRENNEASFAGRARTLQRNKADHRVLDHVRREGVHHHLEQLCPADALAAQYADDRVVASCLEIPCPAAPGDLQEVFDELRAQRLGPALDLGVAVQAVGVGSGVLALACEEIEELDQVPLEGVCSALPVLQVVLAEVAVEEHGAYLSEIPLYLIGGQPRVQVLAGSDVGVDRLLFLGASVALLRRSQVVLELGVCGFPVRLDDACGVGPFRVLCIRPVRGPDVVAWHCRGLFSGRRRTRRLDAGADGTAGSRQAVGELECFSSGQASALAPRCSASTPATATRERTVSRREPVP